MPAPSPRQEPSSSDASSLPPLTYTILTTPADKRDALALVADSIAQQRQTASFAIITHPAYFLALVAACTFAYQHNADDLGTFLIVVSGLVIVYLAGVRLLTSRYLTLAEAFHWPTWLRGADEGDEDDLVLAARFGEELIATLVLRVQRSGSQLRVAETQQQQPPRDKNKKNAKNSKNTTAKSQPQGTTGSIRAWTTKLRYRNKGVGADMLRFAVVTTRSACGPDAPVAFDAEHANSALPLPSFFNAPFTKRDAKAAAALARALRDCEEGEASFEAR